LAQGLVQGIEALSLGLDTLCALRDDDPVTCWGNDEFGQVSGANGAGGGVVEVTTTFDSTCLVFGDGTAHCYGTSGGAEGSGFYATSRERDVWDRPAVTDAP
jgi:hypothetical protein